MRRSGADPKVKKTIVRDCEKKIKPGANKYVARDFGSTSRGKTAKKLGSSAKENELDHPTLCSSEILAQYLTDVKISSPPSLTIEDLNEDKERISTKVRKHIFLS